MFFSSIIESVQETLFKCGPQSGHGRIVYIGWKSSGFDFKPLITICHDRTIDHTYFANHEIIGKSYLCKISHFKFEIVTAIELSLQTVTK